VQVSENKEREKKKVSYLCQYIWKQGGEGQSHPTKSTFVRLEFLRSEGGEMNGDGIRTNSGLRGKVQKRGEVYRLSRSSTARLPAGFT